MTKDLHYPNFLFSTVLTGQETRTVVRIQPCAVVRNNEFDGVVFPRQGEIPIRLRCVLRRRALDAVSHGSALFPGRELVCGEGLFLFRPGLFQIHANHGSRCIHVPGIAFYKKA